MKINILHERLQQASACVTAIEVALGDRAAYPGQDTIADEVLTGLASAAVELLRQADEAADGYLTLAKAQRERSHGYRLQQAIGEPR